MTETRKELLDNLVYQIKVFRKDRNIPFKIAIDGVDASGKTELAKQLFTLLKDDNLSVIHASLDNFHNDKQIRYSLGKRSPEGYYKRSFNYDKLVNDLLIPLKSPEISSIKTSCFNYKEDSKTQDEPIDVLPNSILLFDGIFLSRPKLQKYWDLYIYVHIDFNIVLKRAKIRDIDYFENETELESMYLQKYIPGQILYINECNPLTEADILINNNNYDHPFFIVNSKEKELFQKHSLDFFSYH